MSDKGKWAEKQVQSWLDRATQVRHDFAYHRYPDARAARGALAAQPADFLVCDGYERKAYHLEVKETSEKNRLPRSKIAQYGKLKLFWWAGVDPRIIVYRSLYKDWIVLDEDDLFPGLGEDETPASFAFGDHTSYFTADAALNAVFSMRIL